MLNDFKKGFWYSIGAITGVCVLQWITSKFIEKPEKEEDYMEGSE